MRSTGVEHSCIDLEQGPHRQSSSYDADCGLGVPDGEDRVSPGRALGESCGSSFEADAGRGEAAAEKECRICQLGLESNAAESGVPIVLGCSCKDELGAAHKHCAETWFKIRGNKTCEICGSTARNVVDMLSQTELTEHCHETGNSSVRRAQATETQGFWQGHRFLNFMLACMIFAFVVSWLFHFNVPG
ncbi:uncharacterized protein M6B38_125080 [Iris pallida]|uniref:RING-CH-type domain-containing protein n=1 Tax=Iris pallida TaxID=29817 RepID=A0AAX6GWP3_IRIPA|nr:uncharacterized protein M6B38_125080 [Iris pallida]